MLITSTSTIEGRPIRQYCGLVSGEAIVGTNIFKDMFAGIRDVVGGRAGAYENTLRKARQIALDDLTSAAKELGANAVVGIQVDYEVLGEKNGILMVAINGTAVVI
ncbi:MAG: heavy metal-binding domain-containing protein [Dechloromonas sp.]|nr:heavy metal-binding domain-containing protein [Dechloromonas sp.]